MENSIGLKRGLNYALLSSNCYHFNSPLPLIQIGQLSVTGIGVLTLATGKLLNSLPGICVNRKSDHDMGRSRGGTLTLPRKAHVL